MCVNKIHCMYFQRTTTRCNSNEVNENGDYVMCVICKDGTHTCPCSEAIDESNHPEEEMDTKELIHIADICPIGLYAHVSIVDGLVECKDGCPDGQWKYNNTCVATCPDQSPYMATDTGECVHVCPVSSFHQDLYCMPCHGTCLQSAGCTGPSDRDCTRCATAEYVVHMHKRTCVLECTYPSQFYEMVASDPPLYQCLDSCVKLYIWNPLMNMGECVEYCPSEHDVIVDNKCTPGPCPDKYKFYFRDGNMTRCLQQCPSHQYHVPGSYECREHCVEPFKFVSENYCLPRCPEDSHFYLRESHRCVKMCPEYGNTETCIRICPAGRPHVYNDTCLSSCPAAAKYHAPDDPTCYTTCPGNMVHLPNHTECLPGCPDGQNFTANSTCLTSCPESALYFTTSGGINACAATCQAAIYHVQGSYQCLEECPVYAINSTGCRTFCPGEKPYCSPASWGTNEIISQCDCVTSCDKLTVDITKTCNFFDEGCPNYARYQVNMNCYTRHCPDTHPFHQQDNVYKCLVECPTGLGHELGSFSCLSKCPAKQRYIDDATCSDTCSKAYHLQTTHGIECLDNCPNNTFILLSDNSTEPAECVRECPAKQRYIDNAICHDTCSKVYRMQTIHGTECLDNCPINTFILLSDNSTELAECVRECPDNKIYSVNQVCSKSCPDELPFMLTNRTISCLARCDGNMFQLRMENESRTQCIANCPPDKPYAIDKACSTSCLDTSYIFNKSGTILCLDYCPPGSFIPEVKGNPYTPCIPSCDGPSLGNQCVEKCPILYHLSGEEYYFDDHLYKNVPCVFVLTECIITISFSLCCIVLMCFILCCCQSMRHTLHSSEVDVILRYLDLGPVSLLLS